VSRLFLIAVIAVLLGDASGVMAFVTPEACTSVTDTQPDGKCPSLCVRCACCAQPIVPAVTAVVRSYELAARPATVVPFVVMPGSPHDILHVPK
jgi:hypothetical protein